MQQNQSYEYAFQSASEQVEFMEDVPLRGSFNFNVRRGISPVTSINRGLFSNPPNIEEGAIVNHQNPKYYREDVLARAESSRAYHNYEPMETEEIIAYRSAVGAQYMERQSAVLPRDVLNTPIVPENNDFTRGERNIVQTDSVARNINYTELGSIQNITSNHRRDILPTRLDIPNRTASYTNGEIARDTTRLPGDKRHVLEIIDETIRTGLHILQRWVRAPFTSYMDVRLPQQNTITQLFPHAIRPKTVPKRTDIDQYTKTKKNASPFAYLHKARRIRPAVHAQRKPKHYARKHVFSHPKPRKQMIQTLHDCATAFMPSLFRKPTNIHLPLVLSTRSERKYNHSSSPLLPHSYSSYIDAKNNVFLPSLFFKSNLVQLIPPKTKERTCIRKPIHTTLPFRRRRDKKNTYSYVNTTRSYKVSSKSKSAQYAKHISSSLRKVKKICSHLYPRQLKQIVPKKKQISLPEHTSHTLRTVYNTPMKIQNRFPKRTNNIHLASHVSGYLHPNSIERLHPPESYEFKLLPSLLPAIQNEYLAQNRVKRFLPPDSYEFKFLPSLLPHIKNEYLAPNHAKRLLPPNEYNLKPLPSLLPSIKNEYLAPYMAKRLHSPKKHHFKLLPSFLPQIKNEFKQKSHLKRLDTPHVFYLKNLPSFFAPLHAPVVRIRRTNTPNYHVYSQRKSIQSKYPFAQYVQVKHVPNIVKPKQIGKLSHIVRSNTRTGTVPIPILPSFTFSSTMKKRVRFAENVSIPNRLAKRTGSLPLRADQRTDRISHPVLNLAEQKSSFRVRPIKKVQCALPVEDHNRYVYTIDRTYQKQEETIRTQIYPISFVPDPYKTNRVHEDITPSIRTSSETTLFTLSRPENIIYSHTKETQEMEIRQKQNEYSLGQRISFDPLLDLDIKKSVLENPRYNNSTEDVD